MKRFDLDARLIGWGLVSCALATSGCEKPDAEKKPKPEPVKVEPPPAQPATPPPAPAPKRTPVATPETPHWDYGDHGPTTWSALDPAFSSCGSGKSQSPIELPKSGDARNQELVMKGARASLRVVHHEHVADGVNNGHTLQINAAGEDALTFGSKVYDLVQFHFHAPSEHTREGKHFPMEMHLVHRAKDKSLAVVGVLIEEGKHHPALDPIWANLPKEKGVELHYEHITVTTDDLLPNKRSALHYSGSLTTPPCSEGVDWLVLEEPIQLSKAQIEAFESLYTGNNRPTQERNGRAITGNAVPDAK